MYVYSDLLDYGMQNMRFATGATTRGMQKLVFSLNVYIFGTTYNFFNLVFFIDAESFIKKKNMSKYYIHLLLKYCTSKFSAEKCILQKRH